MGYDGVLIGTSCINGRYIMVKWNISPVSRDIYIYIYWDWMGYTCYPPVIKQWESPWTTCRFIVAIQSWRNREKCSCLWKMGPNRDTRARILGFGEYCSHQWKQKANNSTTVHNKVLLSFWLWRLSCTKSQRKRTCIQGRRRSRSRWFARFGWISLEGLGT